MRTLQSTVFVHGMIGQAELQNTVRRYIHSLAPEEHLIFLLRFYESLEYREIGKIMNLPVKEHLSTGFQAIELDKRFPAGIAEFRKFFVDNYFWFLNIPSLIIVVPFLMHFKPI